MFGKKKEYYILVLLLFFYGMPWTTAQELEPRSLTNLPIGTNIAAAVYGFSSGNVLFDPALPLEDVQANIHAFGAAYIRSLDFFGMSAKVNVVVPYVSGDWEAVVQGVDSSTARSGFADISFGFSFNFIGSPALNLEEYSAYKQGTIVGASIQLVAPTGKYDPTKLINLGTNRWSVRPQVGVSHRFNKWYFELSSNVWIFTKNNAFLETETLEQHPILTVKTHIIRSISPKAWVAIGAGFANGGQSVVSGLKKNSHISTIRLGLIGTYKFTPQHSVKLNAIVANRIKQGADFDAFSLSYQYIWN